MDDLQRNLSYIIRSFLIQWQLPGSKVLVDGSDPYMLQGRQMKLLGPDIHWTSL